MKINKQFKKCKEKTTKFLKWFFIDVVLEKILYELDLIRFHPTKKLRVDAVTNAYQIGNFKLVTRIKLPIFRRTKLGFKENPQIALFLLASYFCPQISLLAIPLFFGTLTYGATTSTGTDDVSASTLSYSHTAATGDDVVAITGAGCFYSGTLTISATYAASAMTFEIYKRSTGVETRHHTVLLSKASPTSGSQTVIVNFGESCTFRKSGTISFTGGNTSNVVGATASGDSASTASSPSTNITSTVAGSIIVDTIYHNNGDVTASVGANQTKRWNDKTTENREGAGSTEPAATVQAYTMSWGAGAAYWSQCVVEVLAAPIVVPTVTTQAVSSIAQTTATGNGNITNDGGDAGATRGICWDTSSAPTTSDDHDTNGTGEGAYTVAMTGLTPGTHYYVRAYSINSAGTSYGSEVEFDSLPYIRTKGITARGRIKQIAIEGKITARGRIEQSDITKAITSRARVQATTGKAITALANIFNTIEKAITARGRMKQLAVEKKVTARARVEQADISKTITSRARIETLGEKVLTALARVEVTPEKKIAARADILNTIEKAISSRGRVKQLEVEGKITSLGRIETVPEKTLSALARLKLLVEKSVTSKARVQVLEEEKITARARVQQAGVESKITAMGTIEQLGVEKKATARARLKHIGVSKILTILGRIKTAAIEKALTLKARIEIAGVGKILSSRVFIVSVGKTILDSPTTGSSELSPITFEWIIPSNRWGENMNFHLQIDQSSDSFGDLELEKRSWQDSGFEYWDGGGWVPLTTDGVSSAYFGNKARYIATITAGVKYWRVKAFAG